MPIKPKRLIQLETPGWEMATTEARQQLEAKLSALSGAGIEIISRQNNKQVEALEKSLIGILQCGYDIIGYESRWPLKSVAYRDRLGLSPGVLDQIVEVIREIRREAAANGPVERPRWPMLVSGKRFARRQWRRSRDRR